MKKTYTEKDMLILYATIDERAYLHEDFPKYQRKLVKKLQELFNVDLSDPPKLKALYFLFRSTVRTYKQAGVHPLSGYLEASLIHITLREKTGDAGRETNNLLNEIGNTCELKQKQYQELMYQLYDLIWGATGKVVTSEDLAKVGFDTSNKPDMADYW